MNGSANERVVGYDVRQWATVAPDWLGQRRAQYLLRPDVTVPLSTDEAVWPTMFDPDLITAAPLMRAHWTGRNGNL